ncbi:hypothetical protein GCM10018777_03470 [Streptomyces albogriseolus]|uniref:hypothetical protein n=1 Tax=Streptomyces albogriseolus TaxID=1887 RepID=UPI00167B6DD2|nr:hypothetical protein [Streptomyces viridodiastaticus]GHF96618.1 hypothetical protein GCM10018777_03470 [Streptomyces viridodiastaticus]
MNVEDLRLLEHVTSHARTQLARLVHERDLTDARRGGGGRAGRRAESGVLRRETMALAEGYELLDLITLLSRLPRSVTRIGGVLTLPDDTPEVDALAAARPS